MKTSKKIEETVEVFIIKRRAPTNTMRLSGILAICFVSLITVFKSNNVYAAASSIEGNMHAIAVTTITHTVTPGNDKSELKNSNDNNGAGVAAKEETDSKENNNVASNMSLTSKLLCIGNSPCAIIKNASQKILETVNKGLSTKQTMALIENVIVPQFDFNLMTKYAMGINWRQANIKEQKELAALFRQLLIYTYSSAIYKFKNGQISIDSENIDGNKASVVSEVTLANSANNQPVQVEYNLAKTGEGGSWKVYDIKIENVSLVTTYRNQFNAIVQNDHVSGLLAQLKTKVNSLKAQEF